MRQIGIHLSYWQFEWADNLLPLIQKAHQAGFEVAEFPLLTPTKLDYPNLRTALDETGMQASCGTGLRPETDITHPDLSIRKAGLAHLRACLNGASLMGSPVLGGLTYAPWGVFPKDNCLARRKQCIESLKDVTKMAVDYNVTVCLEVVNRFEGYLMNTVTQGLEILSEVGSQNLKLHLDTFHMNIEEDHIGDAIRLAGQNLGHLHCVENNRKIPGQGHIPWSEVSQALAEINYNGYIVAEIFVNPEGEVGRGMFIWRSLADDLDVAAAQAATFLKRELANV